VRRWTGQRLVGRSQVPGIEADDVFAPSHIYSDSIDLDDRALMQDVFSVPTVEEPGRPADRQTYLEAVFEGLGGGVGLDGLHLSSFLNLESTIGARAGQGNA
jgi:hypothetical protein